jgi:predicted HAD superfamily hydrolase
VGRQKILKCDFFNYIKIKNHKKWKSEKTKQLERVKNKALESNTTKRGTPVDS